MKLGENQMNTIMQQGVVCGMGQLLLPASWPVTAIDSQADKFC
jgi:hypothetical protein